MAHREFTDQSGVTWQVWDVIPTLLDSRRPSAAPRARVRPAFLNGWLAFQCPSERRRLVPVPDRWQEMDDAALAGLCAQAEILGPPKRLIE